MFTYRLVKSENLFLRIIVAKDFGLFLPSEEDNKKGVWLELGRSLEYYILRNGDVVEYKKKTRTLRVRMLDGEI